METTGPLDTQKKTCTATVFSWWPSAIVIVVFVILLI